MQLFDTEANRKIKRDPPLALELKNGLFPSAREEPAEDDVPGVGTDVVSELWTF